jgi:hypothetical protein
MLWRRGWKGFQSHLLHQAPPTPQALSSTAKRNPNTPLAEKFPSALDQSYCPRGVTWQSSPESPGVSQIHKRRIAIFYEQSEKVANYCILFPRFTLLFFSFSFFF